MSAFISESSLANGLLIWPLLLLLALGFRLRPVLLAVLAITAAVCIAGYLAGYRSPSYHADPLNSLISPSARTGVPVDLLRFGFDWCQLALWTTLRHLSHARCKVCYTVELSRKQVSLLRASLLSLCVFLLGTGFLTALGRINFALVQAASSRYQSSASLFWLCFGLYLMDLAYRRQPSLALYLAGVLSLCATVTLRTLPFSVQGAQEITDKVVSGSLPIYADVKDDGEIAKLAVHGDLVFICVRSYARTMPPSTSVFHTNTWVLVSPNRSK